ncbi:hypothetical protein D3C80_1477910 [compost metagenome]
MHFGNSHDLVHVASDTCIMYGYDGFGFFRDGSFNQRLVDVHGIRADIDENNLCTAQHKCICRTDEGITWHYDFVAWLNVDQQSRHFKCLGTGGCQQCLFTTQAFLKPRLTAQGIFTIARHFAATHGSQYILVFIASIGWFVKRNHALYSSINSFSSASSAWLLSLTRRAGTPV